MSEARRRLKEGDRARDRRDWAAAAEAYGAYLALRPQDGAIHVQHGNSLKEAGDLAAALAAYARAESLLPGDADVQVQIGHARKLTGDLAGAEAAYAAAVERDPTATDGWRELSSLLTGPGRTTLPATAGGILFDLSDLMSWFGTHRAPSGIQRVQLAIVTAALTGPSGPMVGLAAFDAASGSWRALPRPLFLRLAALAASGADTSDASWQETMGAAGAALAGGPPLPLPEGGWLVNLGTSWEMPGYELALRGAKARAGTRFAALLHDCGPLAVPEHAEPGLAARFAAWFARLPLHADLILVAAAATEAEWRALRAQHLPGLPDPPVARLPFDAALPAPPPAPRIHPLLAGLLGRRYVLSVGTLESRKDHLFLLHGWAALLRRHGARMPRLVLVGRPGFGAEAVLALLNANPALARGVEVLSDVSDEALARLYDGAMFTLYTSRHEGWGLPVTEALSRGKAVLAPGAGAMLEAGLGAAVTYVPGSEPDFLARLESLLFDGAARRAAEAAARAAPLRSWADVAAGLLAALANAPAAMVEPPRVALGQLLSPGLPAGRLPSAAAALGEAMRLGPLWHTPEPFGCWTRPGRALLRLHHVAPAGTRLRLLITLTAPPEGARLWLRPGGADPRSLEIEPGDRATAALDWVAEEGPLDLTIEAPAATLGDRQVGVGLVSVMICAADDLAARLEYLERQRFVWPELA